MMSKWEEKWLEDIEYLKDNLIDKHKNIFFEIKEEEFYKSIENLKSIINQVDYNDMKVELSKVIASIKDAHTSLMFPVDKYIPVKFYWFEDGVYIIKATERYKKLIGSKVIAIDGVEITEILDKLSEVISYENKYFFKAQSMKYMQAVDVLYGVLISDSLESVKLKSNYGEVEIETVSGSELIYFESKLPLYAQKDNENLWWKYLSDNNELYIKYNYCREDTGDKLSEKIERVIKVIEEKKVFKLTIDLRNNLGGDSRLIKQLLKYIKNSEIINNKKNLKVIIGRETFSSGLLNAYEFKFQTNAILIGEPSGGKPNCYGEVLKFILPNSKFVVSYSTRYYKLIEDDNIISLYPDEIIYEKIEDFL